MAYWILLTVTYNALVASTGVNNNECNNNPAEAISCSFDEPDHFCQWSNGTNNEFDWESHYTHPNSTRDYYVRALTGKQKKNHKAFLTSHWICPIENSKYNLTFRYRNTCDNGFCSLLVQVKFKNSSREGYEWKTNKSQGWIDGKIEKPVTSDVKFRIAFMAQTLKKGNKNSEIGIDRISFQPSTTTASKKPTTEQQETTPLSSSKTTPTTIFTSGGHNSTEATKTTRSHGNTDDAGDEVWIAVAVTISLLVVGAIVFMIVILIRRKKGGFACHIFSCLKKDEIKRIDASLADRMGPGVQNATYTQGEEIVCITTPGAAVGVINDAVNKKPETSGTHHNSNVNDTIKVPLKTTEAEYSRLGLDLPRQVNESGAEKAGGHDVYSHLHGEDGEYRQLDFDHDKRQKAEVRSQDNIDEQDMYSHLQADD